MTAAELWADLGVPGVTRWTVVHESIRGRNSSKYELWARSRYTDFDDLLNFRAVRAAILRDIGELIDDPKDGGITWASDWPAVALALRRSID